MRGRTGLRFLLGHGQDRQSGHPLDRIVIIVAIIAVTVTLFVTPGINTLGTTLIGFVLLMTLYAADRLDESLYECASFGGAWALCIILILGIILINPLTLWVGPFVNSRLHVVDQKAQDMVTAQITDGFAFVFGLAFGIPMTFYRYRLLVQRRNQQSSQGQEAPKERQHQVLPLQSSPSEGRVSGKAKLKRP